MMAGMLPKFHRNSLYLYTIMDFILFYYNYIQEQHKKSITFYTVSIVFAS